MHFVQVEAVFYYFPFYPNIPPAAGAAPNTPPAAAGLAAGLAAPPNPPNPVVVLPPFVFPPFYPIHLQFNPILVPLRHLLLHLHPTR